MTTILENSSLISRPSPSFPSLAVQLSIYCKQQEAGQGPGNEARKLANRVTSMVNPSRNGGYWTVYISTVHFPNYLNTFLSYILFSLSPKCSPQKSSVIIIKFARKFVKTMNEAVQVGLDVMIS